jgi:hypothetical protein
MLQRRAAIKRYVEGAGTFVLNRNRTVPPIRMPKIVRFLLLQLNGLFPFLYPARHVLGVNLVRGVSHFVKDYATYRAMPADPRFPLTALDMFPCLYDRWTSAGEMPLHYFHQDLWAAKHVRASGAPVHYDFGSRIDGFVAHCLSFCRVVVFDIRNLDSKVDGLSFVQGDITSLHNVPAKSVPSLSSLHAIEHIGLGRYGDPIDPEGYRKAIRELQRVAMQGAPLYIGVPVGRQRLEFNGQRVFDPEYVVECFDSCELVEFSAVDDDNTFVRDADLKAFKKKNYSCGLFRFVKKAP